MKTSRQILLSGAVVLAAATGALAVGLEDVIPEIDKRIRRALGAPFAGTAPTTNQILKYNGTAWAPAADGGGGETLAQTLALGATTGGTSLTVSTGDSLLFDSRGGISASADGVHVLKDTAGTSFGRLCLGGTTNSFPAIKRSSAAVAFRLADDSADASISASGLTLASGISWTSLGTFGPQSDGVFRITDSAATSFGRLQLGGTTSSYPAIKRSSAGVDIRLADDSAYTTLTASNLLGAKGIFTTSGATSSNAVLNANDAAYAGISAILYTGTNSATPDRFQSSSSAGVDYDKRMVLYRTRGTMAAPTSATDGDYVGGLVGQILTSNDVATCEVAAISMRVMGTVGNGTAGGAMLFQTTNAAGSALQSRFGVRNDGALAAPTGGLLAWTSSATDPLGTVDTTLSRNSAGWLQAGTTTANASGNVLAAKFGQSTTVFSTSGSGSPEGAVTADKGSLYTDTGSGAVYKKTTNSANTGWSEIAGGGLTTVDPGDFEAVSSGVGACFIISAAFTTIAANTDVVVYNANAPFAFEVVDAWVLVTAGAAGSSNAGWRDATGGGGNLISSFLQTQTVGMIRDSKTTARSTISAGGSFVWRSGAQANASGTAYAMCRRL